MEWKTKIWDNQYVHNNPMHNTLSPDTIENNENSGRRDFFGKIWGEYFFFTEQIWKFKPLNFKKSKFCIFPLVWTKKKISLGQPCGKMTISFGFFCEKLIGGMKKDILHGAFLTEICPRIISERRKWRSWSESNNNHCYCYRSGHWCACKHHLLPGQLYLRWHQQQRQRQ